MKDQVRRYAKLKNIKMNVNRRKIINYSWNMSMENGEDVKARILKIPELTCVKWEVTQTVVQDFIQSVIWSTVALQVGQARQEKKFSYKYFH